MSDRIGRQAELITAELITRGASITKRLKLPPHNAIGTSSSDRLHQNRDAGSVVPPMTPVLTSC
jgi:hypothetical protein